MKTLKWIYNLGKLHERRRIKLLISQHTTSKPVESDYSSKESFRRSMNLWYAVQRQLEEITQPPMTHIEQEYVKPLIDEDL